MNSGQLDFHTSASLKLPSRMPCLNHSSANLFRQLIKKNTFTACIMYCCGYKLNVIWHCRRNIWRSSRFDLSNMSGGHTQVWLLTWGTGGGGSCHTCDILTLHICIGPDAGPTMSYGYEWVDRPWWANIRDRPLVGQNGFFHKMSYLISSTGI